MVLLNILRLPFIIIKAPISITLRILGIGRRQALTLPTAGLHESKAQSIFFTLRRAATRPEEEKLGLEWLASLQIVEVASARLLSELDIVESNLRFWNNRLNAGQHFWFTLLCQGPVAFVSKLSQLINRRRRRRHRRHRHQQQLQAGEEEQEEEVDDEVTDIELVEKRVLIFHLLRGELCEAVAAVQRAGALLYLQQQSLHTGDGDGDGREQGQEQDPPPSTVNIFERAQQSIQASLSLVVRAFDELESAVHSTLDMQRGPQGPATRDQPMLTQALGRVLGVMPLRRMFGSQQGQPLAARQQEHEEEEVPASSALLPSSTTALLIHAQRTLQFTPTALIGSDITVHTALQDARRVIAITTASPSVQLQPQQQQQCRLIQLPSWLVQPSPIQQNWIKVTLIGVAAGYSTLFIIRHSRLSGSRDIERWAASFVGAVRSAWADHIIGPLERVRGELFNTFRRRPAIVSLEEYEADRDSLQRMLDEFKQDYIRTNASGGRRGGVAIGKSRRTPQATTASSSTNTTTTTTQAGPSSDDSSDNEQQDAQLVQGMEIMMRSYETELKNPVKNIVTGQLLRSLLIQVQKLKVDTESAMLEIDQILRANELTISVLAAIPAFVIAGTGLYFIGSSMTPTPPDPRREAVPARLAMIEVERALEALAARESEENSGMFIFKLALAYSEAEQLFKRHTGMFRSSGDSEWNNLRLDLLDLATPGVTGQKLRTAARMMRVYAIYQQF